MHILVVISAAVLTIAKYYAMRPKQFLQITICIYLFRTMANGAHHFAPGIR